MILINPYYIITNVIFVDTSKEFVFVERSVWNTVISLLFKHKEKDLAKIKFLKNIIYKVYVEFNSSQTINYHEFNQAMSLLQTADYKPSDYGFDLLEVKGKVPEYEVILTDESNFFKDDQFLDEEKGEELELSSQEISIYSQIPKLDEKVRNNLNLNLSLSLEHRLLVEGIGFTRILNRCKELFINDSGTILGMERYFNYNIDLLISIYRARFLAGAPEFYFYYCTKCSLINSHRHHPVINGNRKFPERLELIEECNNQTRWFSIYKEIRSNEVLGDLTKLRFCMRFEKDGEIKYLTRQSEFDIDLYCEYVKKKQDNEIAGQNDERLNELIKLYGMNKFDSPYNDPYIQRYINDKYSFEYSDYTSIRTRKLTSYNFCVLDESKPSIFDSDGNVKVNVFGTKNIDNFSNLFRN